MENTIHKVMVLKCMHYKQDYEHFCDVPCQLFFRESYTPFLNDTTLTGLPWMASNAILWSAFLHWSIDILGDPGADKGDEGKSKRAEKYIRNEKK